MICFVHRGKGKDTNNPSCQSAGGVRHYCHGQSHRPILVELSNSMLLRLVYDRYCLTLTELALCPHMQHSVFLPAVCRPTDEK